jgi:hypothetical protein
MFKVATKSLTGVAALGALTLGGSAIADAASTTKQSRSSSAGHKANGMTETFLTGDTAAKVRAAALAKLPGGTIERVETDVDFGSPYEAHVRKADGTSVQVLVDHTFVVTAIKPMP